MNMIIYWGKFNLVGIIGMAVQLATLSLFNRCVEGHYLYATAVAVELTLLHNFIWHMHYTWRDRRNGSAIRTQLIRFHLSNGLVSMLGNLVLMRIIIHHTHLPLLLSNSIAILCCSLLNFCLGDRWVFAVGGSPIVRRMISSLLLSNPLMNVKHCSKG
jgi:putative flippase GtrA